MGWALAFMLLFAAASVAGNSGRAVPAQTSAAFWIVLIVLIVLVLRSRRRRREQEPQGPRRVRGGFIPRGRATSPAAPPPRPADSGSAKP